MDPSTHYRFRAALQLGGHVWWLEMTYKKQSMQQLHRSWLRIKAVIVYAQWDIVFTTAAESWLFVARSWTYVNNNGEEYSLKIACWMDKVLNIFAAGHGHKTGSALIYMYALPILLSCSTYLSHYIVLCLNEAFRQNPVDLRFMPL